MTYNIESKQYYKCLKCGATVEAKYHEAPNPGSYFTVKCECTNRGTSAYKLWYRIPGFQRIDGKEKSN